MTRTNVIAGVCFWVCSTLSFTGNGAQYVDHTSTSAAIALRLDDGSQVTLTPVNESTIEVVYQFEGVKQLPGQALAPYSAAVTPTLKKQEEQIWIEAGALRVKVQRSPFNLAFYKGDELRVKEEAGAFVHDTVRGFRFALQPQEKLLGGGERIVGMNRRGLRLPLYNRAHYGYGGESTQMYYSLPAVISSNNYAIVFDNTASGTLDVGHNEADILQFEAVGGRTAYIVSVGDSIAEVSRNVISATGLQPLPPRWALGNFASRFGYRNEQQTREVVNAFEQQRIPLDAVVLDLYWFGKDIKGHMGNLSWDRNAFPTPEAMVSDFAKKNINTIVITEPFVLTTSSQYQSAVSNDALAKNMAGASKTFDFYFGNTGLVDVFSQAGRDWFWQYYQSLAQQGVAGWWGDLGEPEVHPADTIHNWGETRVTADEIHNAFGHQWAKMLYERTLQANPDKRPFILMRSGFMGSQRYGMIPWTGDVSRSWEGLESQIELGLQMGILGLAYTHSDVGGFAGGEEFDPDLYTRWLQFGAFTPVFRPHANEDIAPEPVFHEGPPKAIARDFIQLRYQLLPYNYSLSYENSLYGRPLMRPLAYHYDQVKWFEHKDSFLWGESFLVSPVTKPDVRQWQVDLPQGKWFDFFTDASFEGGQIVSVPVTAKTIPVMVKAGAFVPMVAPVLNTTHTDFSHLQVHYWLDEPNTSSSFTYYEDSGNDPAAIKSQRYTQIAFAAQRRKNHINLSATQKGSYPGMPDMRSFEWVIHGLTAPPQAVEMEKSRIVVSTDKMDQAFWEAQSKQLHIRQFAEASSDKQNLVIVLSE